MAHVERDPAAAHANVLSEGAVLGTETALASDETWRDLTKGDQTAGAQALAALDKAAE